MALKIRKCVYQHHFLSSKLLLFPFWNLKSQYTTCVAYSKPSHTSSQRLSLCNSRTAITRHTWSSR